MNTQTARSLTTPGGAGAWQSNNGYLISLAANLNNGINSTTLFRRPWTLLAVNAGISCILLIAVGALMLRPHTIPYVVMVDRKGEPVGAAQPVLGTQALNDVVIKWAITEFIRNAKTVSANIDEEKELLRNAYAFASHQASKALEDYYHYAITTHSRSNKRAG